MDDPNNDHLVQSNDPEHPANLIPRLCKQFYTLGKMVVGVCGLSQTDSSKDGSLELEEAPASARMTMSLLHHLEFRKSL